MPDLPLADPAAIAETLAYMLTHTLTGRPRAIGRRFDAVTAGAVADDLVEHLRRSGFVVLRRRPPTHSASAEATAASQ